MAPKHRRRFYITQAMKKHRNRLTESQRGYLLTCNRAEKEAIREAYRLLNEYADQLYGKEGNEAATELAEGVYNDNDCGDIDKALEKEKEQLKKLSEQKSSERRFQLVDAGVQNVLFIKTCLEEPKPVVSRLIQHLEATKDQQTRYLLRLVPIETTCKANSESVAQACKKLLPKYFSERMRKISYEIIFKARLNNSFSKEEAYRTIGGAIRDINSDVEVSFKNSDYVVICEVLKGICCLTVLNDYYKYRKYNLMEIVGNHENKCTVPETSKDPVTIEKEGPSPTEHDNI